MSPGRTKYAAVAVCLLAGCTADVSVDPADLVFRSAAVYTVNEILPWASAVAVSGGRISYVGDDEGVQAHIGSTTEVIDLAGRMLMPGFIDSHMHPMAAGTRFLRCDLADLEWPDEIESKIRECATTVKPGKWFRGVNLDDSLFESGVLNKELLDDWLGNIPALITTYSSFRAWVNSATLLAAGIDRSTPDPARGVIDRNPETGEATGVLRNSAVNIPYGLVPSPDTGDLKLALRLASKMANGFGITTSSEASLYSQHHKAYMEADLANELSLKVFASQRWIPEIDGEQLEGVLQRRREAGNGRYSADSVKLFLDGSNNLTGALLRPYKGTLDDYGTLIFTDSELEGIVVSLDAEGLQVHMHTYGDAAVRQGLDALERASEVNDSWDRRHVLAHMALIDSADLPRFSKLGVSANISALWACMDDDRRVEMEALGPERAGRLLAFRSLLESGANVTAGSDWISDSMNPLYSIQVALTRICPGTEGPAWIPEQRVSLEQMIEAYTINGARQFGIEDEVGSIEVGKAADLVVLEQNLFETEASDLLEVNVQLTMLEGEIVFEAPGSLDQ